MGRFVRRTGTLRPSLRRLQNANWLLPNNPSRRIMDRGLDGITDAQSGELEHHGEENHDQYD